MERAAEEKKKAEENKIQYKTEFRSKNASWKRIFQNYKPQIMIFFMCITATLNTLTQPVIAFLKIKLQFTFFSKAEGNTEWEEEAV